MRPNHSFIQIMDSTTRGGSPYTAGASRPLPLRYGRVVRRGLAAELVLHTRHRSHVLRHGNRAGNAALIEEFAADPREQKNRHG
jgi:hypothetical protein